MRRSDDQFFHSEDTHDLVEAVAALKDVTVYAGAGASIDRIGLDWTGIVNRLLEEAMPDSTRRARVLEMYGPMQAASIAESFYGAGVVRDKVRTLLNTGRTWSTGRLASTISNMLTAKAGNPDALAGVITTNFDDYLEQALQGACGESSHPIAFRRVLVPPRRNALQIGHVSCTYLHGYVPSLDRPLNLRGSKESDPILSETQYFSVERVVRDVLERAFRHSDVVIVGASLNDPPLIAALLATVPYRRSRYAVMPLQQWQYSTQRERDEIIDEVTRRFAALRVKPIFPDFYFQVAQFLREAIVCSQNGAGSYSAADSTIRYGARLTSWWSAWWNPRRGRAEEVQADHHGKLFRALREIRNTLECNRSEKLKLELWLRWMPSETHRELKLWASSVGTWPDVESMRMAQVEPDSEYASVQAFCNGRPMLIHAPEGDRPRRWESYFACPIWFPDEANEIPVAIITLASMKRNTSGSLNEGNGEKLELVRTAAEEVGRALVQP